MILWLSLSYTLTVMAYSLPASNTQLLPGKIENPMKRSLEILQTWTQLGTSMCIMYGVLYQYTCAFHIYPASMRKRKLIGHVRLSVCLSVSTKNPSSLDLGLSIFAKKKNVEKLTCLCFFLLDTLYKHLKSCVLSWHCRHAYWSHTHTWPPVQRETMVSVFLGFNLRQFVPILKEAHAQLRGVQVCALQSSSSHSGCCLVLLFNVAWLPFEGDVYFPSAYLLVLMCWQYSHRP